LGFFIFDFFLELIFLVFLFRDFFSSFAMFGS
jgi:hypothetical protein